MSDDIEKGHALEHDVAGFLQMHGYLVRRGVKLSVSAGTAEATDIDVMGIRFGLPLREDRIIADCKGKKRPKPFERVLWTTGLRDIAKAHHALVALPQAPWQARDFAAQAGIEIINAKSVVEALATSNYCPFGEADLSSTRLFEKRFAIAKMVVKGAVREDLRLRQMLVVGHPITNVNRIVVLMADAAEKASGAISEERWIWEVLLRNAAVVGVTMLVRFAAEVKYLPESDRRALVRKRITFGDMPPQKAMALARHTLGITCQFPEPPYTDEFVEAIELLAREPAAAAMVPFASDLRLIGQCLFNSRSGYPWNFHPAAAERAERIAQRLISALCYASEIDIDLWRSSSAAATGEAPKSGQRASVKQLRKGKASRKAASTPFLEVNAEPESKPELSAERDSGEKTEP